MLKFFRKKKESPLLISGVFQKLGRKIETKQRKAAEYLNRKTATLNSRQQLIGLVLFCLLFGSSSAFTIWYSLKSSEKTIKVQPISIPQTVEVPNEDLQAKLLLTDQEIENIRLIRRHLDSLLLTKSGRIIYDSIAHVRPGLLDSLVYIERVYHKQLKINEDGKEK
ncbi:hypothetical protein [Niabella beijingensis]|uniref:hypothetical protein n=1 Tax=Niabella beijingensis TaxID=2872700 RepID=UPI001CBD1219|nr:hypothetical protein [Niabella beijingensis]MBZ4187613.1 hypothetical protein [Niabella beijingensis]